MLWDNMVDIDILKDAALVAAGTDSDLVETMQTYPSNIAILVGPMDRETEIKILTGNILKDDHFLAFFGYGVEGVEAKEQFLSTDGKILREKYNRFIQKWFIDGGAVITYSITKNDEAEEGITLFVELLN